MKICKKTKIGVSAKMKKSSIKSRIRKDELNPLFHFKDEEEDDKVLTKALIRNALKSGKLELSARNLKIGKLRLHVRSRSREIDIHV